MADCAACGRSTAPSDRFCARCGASLDGRAGEADADGGPLLLGRPVEQSATADGDVRFGPSRVWLIAVAGLVLVVVIGLASTLGQDSGGAERVDGNVEILRDAGADAENRTTTTGDASADDDESALASGDEDDAVSVDHDERIASGPLPLGVETGFGVVIGSENSDVIVLNLDTGEQTVLDGARGLPVGVIDSTVILSRAGTIRTVDLEQLSDGATLMAIDDGDGFAPDQLSVRDDLLWAASSFASPRNALTAFSVDGDEVVTIDLPSEALLLPVIALPDLVQVLPGGIYRSDGERLERVSDGLLLAAGERIALVRECDDGLVCETAWRDIGSWRRADLPIPELDASNFFGQLEVAGDDRWLLRFDIGVRGQPGIHVVEIATGEVVWTTEPRSGPTQLPAVSPDGRWLLQFDAAGRHIDVVDLDNGPVAWAFEDVWLPTADAVFFELGEEG